MFDKDHFLMFYCYTVPLLYGLKNVITSFLPSKKQYNNQAIQQ